MVGLALVKVTIVALAGLYTIFTLSTAAGGCEPPLASLVQRKTRLYTPAVVMVAVSTRVSHEVCRFSFELLSSEIQPAGVVLRKL